MRFQVVEKSMSDNYRCFKATVIDTGNESDWMCECFDITNAYIIADSLNSLIRQGYHRDTIVREPTSEDYLSVIQSYDVEVK